MKQHASDTYRQRLQRAGIVCTLLLTLSIGPAYALQSEDDLFKQIERDSINYFTKYTNKKTGLTADSSMPHAPASIATTGFYMLALIAAAENGWMRKTEAYSEIKKTLYTLRNKTQHEHGFFYHFISSNSGNRVWASEASSIDTALVIANALFAGSYFKSTVIQRLAQELYNRVEWDWMLNGTSLFSHGYKPESGFLPYYWDTYSEHLILQALAIGASKHAAPAECWNEWVRLEDTYHDIPVVFAHSGSLFTYQFSHIFIDFKNLSDGDINYFENSQRATLANKAFCLDQSDAFKTYGEYIWGLSASLGPRGYKAYGAKPGRGFHDGTVAPYAIICSLPFTPEESTAAIQHIYSLFRQNVYGSCGFRDSFNLDQNWYATSYIGIDQGATIGMIENVRSGLIWRHFMQLSCMKRWIQRCGLLEK